MNKLNIVITGRRNTGKSSLINNILAQEKVIVSDVAGTTTDPVKKSYEIPGFATIVFTDTAGIDDEGALGQLRIDKSFDAIKQADAAFVVFSGNDFGSYEHQLVRTFKNYETPFLIIHNKSDLIPLQKELKKRLEVQYHTSVIDFSTHTDKNDLLIESIKKLVRQPATTSLIGDLLHEGDIVMLVTPVDSEAPTGRIILPQVQMIRDILDNKCINIVLQPGEIKAFIQKTNIIPQLVITDSQAFKQVAELIPENVPLTSFSIVLARQKGYFNHYCSGIGQVELLKDNDRILMLESCSHHTSCEDIGRVKIPAMLRKYTGKNIEFEFIAGLDQVRRPVTDYAMIIQCGGCMITSKQLKNHLQPAIDAGIPISNYGMVIAYVQGIFKRAVKPFINK